jgi:hypothetical protein
MSTNPKPLQNSLKKVDRGSKSVASPQSSPTSQVRFKSPTNIRFLRAKRPLVATFSQKDFLSKQGPYTLGKVIDRFSSKQVHVKRIPPQHKNGQMSNIFGSQVTNKPPKVPTALTTQESKEGHK